MRFNYTKATVAAAWVLATSVVGLAAGVGSIFGWFVLAVLALTPPLVMLRLWKAPPESMSESIRQALR